MKVITGIKWDKAFKALIPLVTQRRFSKALSYYYPSVRLVKTKGRHQSPTGTLGVCLQFAVASPQ